MARRRGLAHAFFDSCGAFGSAILHALLANTPALPFGGNGTLRLPEHPAVVLHRSQLSPVFTSGDERFVAYNQRHLPRGYLTNAVISNTVEELEPTGLAMLRRALGGGVPVCPIGPLVRGVQRAASDNDDGGDGRILRLLDTQRPSSVVYVSFGSQNTIRANQMTELAAALECTGRPFVWAVRPPLGFDVNAAFHDEWLPGGFEWRQGARGPWVGAGCRLVLLPMKDDQYLNAVLFTCELCAGVEVACRDEDGWFGRQDVRDAATAAAADGEEGDARGPATAAPRPTPAPPRQMGAAGQLRRRTHAKTPSGLATGGGDDDDVMSEACGSGDAAPERMLCNECDNGCYMFCLRPILPRIPTGDWFCPSCCSPPSSKSASVAAAHTTLLQDPAEPDGRRRVGGGAEEAEAKGREHGGGVQEEEPEAAALHPELRPGATAAADGVAGDSADGDERRVQQRAHVPVGHGAQSAKPTGSAAPAAAGTRGEFCLAAVSAPAAEQGSEK